ncbi:TetR/AcrR family transcriptional regulator [Chondromyces apiculatus]|uniref:Transcriptional regulator, TetR/AcrR family n=1 Tax=Chondromyces apiculatus DSM 436 TaxID=1192034 RepID=A0A017TB64_9BACT|nr:TetR/AcrR family transcriptional regulator [Chondromyces apiculatus]EYF06147.1 transcriptional regulator, TetR/AcrR family [Chondromyces apiculatus DSM 436]
MASKTRSAGQSGSFIEAARRAQLVQCAIDTIASEGYAQASLAHIAERAGISKGVISYHFAGKDELIEQVLTEIMTLAVKTVIPEVEAQPTARDKLRVYIERNIAFVGGYPAHAITLLEIWTGMRSAEGQQRFDARSYEAGFEYMKGIFRQGEEEGDFRPFSHRVMAMMLRGAIDAVLLQRVTYGDQVDLAECAREMVAFFDVATRAATHAATQAATRSEALRAGGSRAKVAVKGKASGGSKPDAQGKPATQGKPARGARTPR